MKTPKRDKRITSLYTAENENNIPNILEFNVRLGDPEAQPILSRLKSDLFDLFY